MLKDVVTAVAMGIEHAMHEEQAAWSEGRQVPDGAATTHLEPAGIDLMSAHEMAQMNLARMEAINTKIADAQFFSVVTDCAKVGFKSRQHIAFALPDNFAAWAPPVVTR